MATSFDAPDSLITDLDHVVADSDEFDNRSEAIRVAIREFIDERQHSDSEQA